MKRLSFERYVVAAMIRTYCRHHEGNAELCPRCQALMHYAEARLTACRYGEAKPSCRHCPIHCYKPDMREHMRAVMRWTGPRMIIYHPTMAIRYFLRF